MANEQQNRQGKAGTTGQPNLSRGDLREGSDRNPGDTLGRDNDKQMQGGHGQNQRQKQAEGGRDEGKSGGQDNSDQRATGGQQGGRQVDPANTGGFSPEGAGTAQGGFGDGSPSESDEDEGLQSFEEDELDNENIGTDEIDEDSTTGGSGTSFGR